MPHIDDGKYNAKALNPAQLITSKAGNPYVQVSFALTDVPGMQLTWRGMFVTDKQRENTIKSLRACGWTGDDVSNIEFPPDNHVIVETETSEYEGKLHSSVKWVNAVRGPDVKNALPAAEAKAFAAKMRGAILAFDAKNKTANGVNPAAKAVLESPNSNTTDDIPF